jgi:F-box/leucine-rich repeat protein 14
MRHLLASLSILCLATGALAQPPNEYVHQAGQPFSQKDMAELCANKSLKKLDLRGAGLVDSYMAELTGLSSLEELRVDSHRITEKGYAVLAELKGLKKLGLEAISPGEADSTIALLRDHQLEVLDLSGGSTFTGKELAGLRHKSMLKALDLSGFRGEISDGDLASIKDFTGLVSLDLNGHSKFKKDIKYLEGMTQLETLNLYGCVGIEDEGYNSLFKKLPNLKNLNMGYCWWHKGEGLVFPASLINLNLVESKQLLDSAFSEFPPRNNIVHLNLFQCLPLTDVGIIALGVMPKLKTLNVGCIRALTNESLKSVGKNTTLTKLNISDNDHFDDDGLAHLKDLSDLETLNLWHLKGITGLGFVHLKGLTKLRELNLADCHHIADSSFAYIKSMSALENLYIDNCPTITDAAIAQLSDGPRLKELTLSGCEKLTDATLIQFKSLKSLEYLDISNCVEMTDAGVRMIRKSLPDCTVIR